MGQLRTQSDRPQVVQIKMTVIEEKDDLITFCLPHCKFASLSEAFEFRVRVSDGINRAGTSFTWRRPCMLRNLMLNDSLHDPGLTLSQLNKPFPLLVDAHFIQ